MLTTSRCFRGTEEKTGTKRVKLSRPGEGSKGGNKKENRKRKEMEKEGQDFDQQGQNERRKQGKD